MKHPFHQIHLYEIGSRLFCVKNGKQIQDLTNEIQKKTLFSWADEIWLMGVWKNSPSSQKIAQTMPELQVGYRKIRSKLKQDDVYGSPYSIYEYVPDPLLCESPDLTDIQKWFHSQNKKLILDFVPNHMAIDSPIVLENPNLFLKTEEPNDSKNTFIHPNGIRYYHGKDPYFDGWTDTIQWDFSNSEVERYHIQLLKKIAKQCDGVRCDMAMLPLPNVFEKTFGKKSVYHWKNIIHTIKEEYPEFKFYAEVYWGLEETLQTLGFDATYDKSFYDSLFHQNLEYVYQSIQKRSSTSLIRFLENHDENRAYDTFGLQSKTYFGLLSASPSTILLYDGQELGLSKKIPVQMIVADEEEPVPTIESFYTNALSIIRKRSKSLEHNDIQYFEFNQLPIFARLLYSEYQMELFIWNFNQVSVSGWIPYQEGLYYKEELTDIVSGNVFSQEKKEEGIYFQLNPNQLQWFIF
ncbi:alpha-amylase [Leptospira bouyouniensis]|uniref:Alpha-amylase n=2 Tax=Leptospira bouyouniensis TaxID=2484911 RepID=A0ABY2LAH0_9LEPT|nr:alpha-amylase family glycosyl hydrolase [Leptospira bouyouniensis]TGK52327.1 alpha-amylase [Leptospira bouyouniensis]